ncbi:MAG: HAD-IC family P-type ATPase [Chloroflexota bacterium]
MQIVSNPLTDHKIYDPRGLTENEAVKRRQNGQGNNVKMETSRSYVEIVRQNVFTFINTVLFAIGIVLVILGLYTDAFLSVGIALLNVVVGVVQEMRAKRTLDKIALLTRPKATVIRDGQEKIVDPTEVVLGDILVVHSGDQIVVDGKVVGDGKMDVDESLLTGESDLIAKQAGNPVYSGSFCVTGSAHYEAEKVGADSFANKLTSSARAFRQVKTPLQLNVDFVIRVLVALSILLGVLFGISTIVNQLPLTESAKIAAVVTGLIPNGLFFMTSIAYAMGAVRMAGQGALIQQSNAVESMSNVNVLCLDKTGTLTANRINLNGVNALGMDEAELRRMLGVFAASSTAGNRTSEALAAACPGEKHAFVDEVPFSSARKWSSMSFDSADLRGVYVLGAPELLRSRLQQNVDLPAQMGEWADQGLRVLLFAHRPELTPLHDSLGQPQLPPDLIPLGVVSFSDELRAEAESTLKGFAEAGIRLKIISGDNPQTVAALAKQAGLAGDIGVISGLDLDDMTDSQFSETAEEATIFGRITPQQKEKLVDTLRGRGHYVAMIGDGVNDVLSLKKAHVGIAMQSGSQATRGVADIILLNDSFAALPSAFREGQRIVSGMRDIISLFLSRVFFQTLVIISVAIIGLGFPITPVHMSLLSLFTVGIPTIFLAAWSRPIVSKARLIDSVMHFVIPAGFTLALLGMIIYVGYDLATPPDTALGLARTALTTITTFGGLLLILFVEPPTKFWTGGDEFSGDWRPTIMAIVLGVIYVVIMLVPGLRDFFELSAFNLSQWVITIISLVVWVFLLRFLWRAQIFNRFLWLGSP